MPLPLSLLFPIFCAFFFSIFFLIFIFYFILLYISQSSALRQWVYCPYTSTVEFWYLKLECFLTWNESEQGWLWDVCILHWGYKRGSALNWPVSLYEITVFQQSSMTTIPDSHYPCSVAPESVVPWIALLVHQFRILYLAFTLSTSFTHPLFRSVVFLFLVSPLLPQHLK